MYHYYSHIPLIPDGYSIQLQLKSRSDVSGTNQKLLNLSLSSNPLCPLYISSYLSLL